MARGAAMARASIRLENIYYLWCGERGCRKYNSFFERTGLLVLFITFTELVKTNDIIYILCKLYLLRLKMKKIAFILCMLFIACSYYEDTSNITAVDQLNTYKKELYTYILESCVNSKSMTAAICREYAIRTTENYINTASQKMSLNEIGGKIYDIKNSNIPFNKIKL